MRSRLCPLLLLCAARAMSANAPLMLEVDARDVTRGIQHAHLTMPVHPGPLTLAYPKWIPGEHVGDGPITQVVELRFRTGSAMLPWRRDALDPYLFHLEVPAGASTLDVSFDYLSPPKEFGDGYGETPNVTPHLALLLFNHLLMYPAEAASDALRIRAQLRLPAGWQHDSALQPERVQGDELFLPEVSLTTLIDSPIFAGEFFRSIPLTETPNATRMTIVADARADLAMSDATIGATRRLVAEAAALFGPGHYREYVWLIALGSTLSPDGLEHHESTDIRDAESLFTDPAHLLEQRTIAHEYVHTWNGKYRRPAGLATRNYQQPMVDDLLWVYEGATRYLGDLVLRTRAGYVTQVQARNYLAWLASRMDMARPGRAWRSLGDTATALPGYFTQPSEWTPISRARDYYDEMALVWLDADTLIRANSGGQRSFDDFCKSFYAGPERVPAVHPYTRADVVTALKAVWPLDWEGFLKARVDDIEPRVPVGGIERGGWRLVYDDAPNDFLSAREKVDAADNFSLSLGIYAKSDGEVTDVVHGSPLFAAGLAPGMKLIGIGGRKWNADTAREVLLQAEHATAPIELVVESADLVRVLQIDYHGGLRNPRLLRDESKPDLLSQILSPRTAN